MIKLVFLFIIFLVCTAQKLPSVGDIDAHNKNKFDVKVYKCLTTKPNLTGVYSVESVKHYTASKHANFTDCNEIITALEKAYSVQQEMIGISNMPECNEDAHLKPTTLQEARAVQDGITEKYNKISEAYTQFFTYDETLSNVEICMNYYNEFVVVENINIEEQNRVATFNNAQIMATKYGLLGVYGNESGVTNLVTAIEELERNEITIKEISKYAILENEMNRWELVGAFEQSLVYSTGNVYIALVLRRGVSYPADSLPHHLFQIQKKVDIKKNGYSMYFLKPLI